ncbi:MAG: methyltransferase domain-containing protein [Candidatus Moranbacteria bacterium]|nr:methyltransferase domain-containing protein [Candidatus Moranbacteria bacterium]
MQESAIYKFSQANYDLGAQYFSKTRKFLWSDLWIFKSYLKKGDKVLDFGCGNGRLIQLLSGFGVDYWGVDVSERLIKLAKRKYPGGNFRKIDVFFRDYRKFELNSFDVVFSIGVFHHFPLGEKRKKILERLVMLLRENGVLIITVWNLNLRRFKKYLGDKKQGFSVFKDQRQKFVFERFLYRWENKELQDFLQASNLEILDSGYTLRKKEKVNLYCVARKTV